MNINTVKGIVKHQPLPRLLEIYSVEGQGEYKTTGRASSSSDWVRMNPAALQWCVDQVSATSKDPPSCPEHGHSCFKRKSYCRGLCKCNEKRRNWFRIWELEEGCSDLLPNVSRGHAILESRIKNGNLPHYRPLASTVHSCAAQSFGAMKRSPKTKLLQHVDDIESEMGNER